MYNNYVDTKVFEIISEDYTHTEPQELSLKSLFRFAETKVPDKYWYLASVYTQHKDSKDVAFEDASKMHALMLDADIHTFCPVVHFHNSHKYSKHADDYDFWMQQCLKFVSQSKGIIVCMMANWEKSKGIALEIKQALHLGLPVVYTEFMELPILKDKC